MIDIFGLKELGRICISHMERLWREDCGIQEDHQEKKCADNHLAS